MSAVSLYVHVPFCVVKCGYCDFVSYEVESSEPLDTYLAGLERELDLAVLPDPPCSVFLGGGTPTHLDEERFDRLLTILGQHVDLSNCPEVTIEANPESVTLGKAQRAREAGVTRVSLGAQTFEPALLRFLDRAHTASQTHDAVATMRQAGFDNLSLDLMFSLPGQTLAQWDADLQQALALSPDHLSCYNLTFESGTRLHRDQARGTVQPNAAEHDRELFLHTRQVLGAAGYSPYEISNFAGRGGPSRHNDHYWLQGNYVGVGPGAASHRDGVRSTNLKAVEAWADALRRRTPPVAEAETLTRAQRAREAMWLGIRRSDGIDLGEINARLATDVLGQARPALDALLELGLVTLDDARLALTDAGLLVADTVSEKLLCV